MKPPHVLLLYLCFTALLQPVRITRVNPPPAFVSSKEEKATGLLALARAQAQVCRRMPTYADVCSSMRTYADLCGRLDTGLLTYADVC